MDSVARCRLEHLKAAFLDRYDLQNLGQGIGLEMLHLQVLIGIGAEWPTDGQGTLRNWKSLAVNSCQLRVNCKIDLCRLLNRNHPIVTVVLLILYRT